MLSTAVVTYARQAYAGRLVPATESSNARARLKGLTV